MAEPLEEVFTLPDGRAVTLRPVRPEDAEPTGRFVEQGLSATSRRRRFHSAIRSLAPAQLAALTQVDQDRHVALVAECSSPLGRADHTPLIVAEARYVVEAPGDQAEIALAVADAWQGQGLGAALLDRLRQLGGQRRLRSLRADVMVDNVPMLALLRSRAARLSRHPDDATLRQLWLAVGDNAAP